MINVISGADGGLVIVISPESRQVFNQLVHRATNLWPDATPEIKHFADQVTNADMVDTKGGMLQDYPSQDTSPKRVRRSFVCDACRSDNLVDIESNSARVIYRCSHCMASNRLSLI